MRKTRDRDTRHFGQDFWCRCCKSTWQGRDRRRLFRALRRNAKRRAIKDGDEVAK